MPENLLILLHLAATMLVIVAVGKVFGWMLRLISQPPVIGEILAGIALGPSLLASFAPQVLDLLIPDRLTGGPVLSTLGGIAKVGVILYMFLVGLELSPSHLASRARQSSVIALIGIVLPFALGSALAWPLYPALATPTTGIVSFALFLGVALSITAFPVLARILADRGMERTELGILALGSAAIADVVAWCLLAVVLGVAGNDATQAPRVIGGAIAFTLLLVFAVGPIIRTLTRWLEPRGTIGLLVAMGLVLMLVAGAAYSTHLIGVHALFGAFLVGVILPHDGKLAQTLTARMKAPVGMILLPAFFAIVGLRTELKLLQGWDNWLYCLGIIFLATLGKFGGTTIAGRLLGLRLRESATLGALMNTRGLMELIVLNIGLELGIISPTLFAMMVVMALGTTMMTGPLLNICQSIAANSVPVALPELRGKRESHIVKAPY